jgi:hypothetical protein
MKLNPSRYFPYPVLKPYNNDYKNCLFQVTLSVEQRHKSLKLSYSYKIESETIIDLINSEKAEVLFHVENPKTKYRKIVYATEDAQTFDLDLSNLNGNLYVLPIIIAKQEIQSFASNEFIEDYDGLEFYIEPGNILGIYYHFKIDVEKDIKDDVEVDSIINISKKDDLTECFEVDLQHPRITIYVNENTFRHYNSLTDGCKKHKLNIANSMLVIPVLVHVFDQLQKRDEDGATVKLPEDLINKKWYRSLKQILISRFDIDIEKNKFKDMSSLKLTNMIMENLSEKGLEQIVEKIG